MAKQYNPANPGNTLGLTGPVKMQNAAPVDGDSIFATFAEMQAYARNGATSYVTQTLKCLDNPDKLYQIKNVAGDLEVINTPASEAKSWAQKAEEEAGKAAGHAQAAQGYSQTAGQMATQAGNSAAAAAAVERNVKHAFANPDNWEQYKEMVRTGEIIDETIVFFTELRMDLPEDD